MGGMGNQFFQYAFAKSLCWYYSINGINKKVFIDSSSYMRDTARKDELKNFSVDIPYVNKLESLFWELIYKLHVKGIIRSGRIFNETSLFGYQEGYSFFAGESKTQTVDKDYYVGFWQNTRYFKQIKGTLQKELVFRSFDSEIEADNDLKNNLDKIKNSNSIAVHVRRGDFLSSQYSGDYVVQEVDYYQKAIKRIKELVSNPVFFVFSDDIDWCRANFSILSNEETNATEFVFVSSNSKNAACIEFELMKRCKHFVIANSTFSWWPAWLSDNEQAVKIAPKQWFYNIEWQEKVIPALLSEFELI